MIARNCTAVLGVVVVLLSANVTALTEGPIALGSRLEPLIDDYLIAEFKNAELKLHPAIPREVSIVHDKPWEGNVCCYHTVFQDGDVFRMYYRGAHYDEQLRKSTHPELYCYATSDDGIGWDRPKLGLFEYGGSKDNNIVLTDMNYGSSVVYDPDDPDPERRYKSAYFKRGMAVAFSPDGIHWKVHPKKVFDRYSGGARGQPPLAGERPRYLPLSISDVIDVSCDPVRKVWMCYAKTWVDGPDGQTFWRRALVRTDSEDFINWTPARLVVPPDELDEVASLKRGAAKSGETAGGGTQGIHVHGGPAFYYNGIYFSLLQMIDSRHTGLMPAELAISRDGYEFERPFREDFFIPTDGGTSFDSGTIWTNATPIFLDDEVRFYYGAYRGNWKKGLITKPTGIGLGTIPRDRFAGIRPIEKVGQITLKPLEISQGTVLEVNANAGGGLVGVEVLDEHGHRLKGFSKADAEPLRTDALRHWPKWKETKLSDLPAGRYSLRVHLTGDATVYAMNLVRLAK